MNYLIVGFGKSGIGALKLLEKNNETSFVYDQNKTLIKKMQIAKIFSQKTTFLQKIDAKILKNINYIVLSPGIEPKKYEKLAQKFNIKIISELELGFMFCSCPVLAVTGTNGKTTTVNLLYEMLKQKEEKTFLVGNVGTSFCETLAKETAKLFVCEVSSFQLEHIEKFNPQIVGFLNIQDDHLCRYKTFESYFNAKKQIVKNFSTNNTLIVNYDDKKLLDFSRTLNAQKYYFSLEKLPKDLFGAYTIGEKIIFKLQNSEFELPLKNVPLLGRHNLYNVMCATLMAILCGLDFQTVCFGIQNFKIPQHRIEFVDNINGIKFYNDSKATNIHSVLNAINCFDEKILLLLGGKDKGENFDNLFKNLNKNVARIFVFGEAGRKILKSAKRCGFKNVEKFKHLIDAYKKINTQNIEEKIVLLSPACSSFDEFSSFEERGNYFKSLVKGRLNE